MKRNVKPEMANERRHVDAFVDGLLTPFRGVAQPSRVPRRKAVSGGLADDWRAVGKDLRTAMGDFNRK